MDILRTIGQRISTWLQRARDASAGAGVTPDNAANEEPIAPRRAPDQHERTSAPGGAGRAETPPAKAAGPAPTAEGEQSSPSTPESGDLHENMEKALAMKKRAGPAAHIPEHRTAREGMNPHGNDEAPPSGALDHGGNTPALKRAHGVRRSDTG